MKIQPIFSPQINYRANLAKKTLNQKKEQTIDKSYLDTGFSVEKFLIKKAQKKQQAIFNSFLKQPGRVSKKDYKKIKSKNPEIIRQARLKVEKEKDKIIFISPKTLADTSSRIKKVFNEKYGQNYQIISIGTSPAAICEALENQGCIVSYMPASCIRKNFPEITKSNYSDMVLRIPNLIKTLTYLKKQHKFDPNNKILVMDFCATGETLRKVSKLIKYYFNIPEENLESINIGELIKNVYSGNEKEAKTAREIMTAIGTQRVDVISNTPHFQIIPYFDEDKIPNPELYSKGNFKSFCNPYARAYSLCVIDELEKMKTKKIRQLRSQPD